MLRRRQPASGGAALLLALAAAAAAVAAAAAPCTLPCPDASQRTCPDKGVSTSCKAGSGWLPPNRIANGAVPLPPLTITWAGKSLDLLKVLPLREIVRWTDHWYDYSKCDPPTLRGASLAGVPTNFGACDYAPFMPGESYIVGTLTKLAPMVSWQREGFPAIEALRDALIGMGGNLMSVCLGVQPCGGGGTTTVLGVESLAPFAKMQLGPLTMNVRMPGLAYNDKGNFVPPLWKGSGQGPPAMWSIDPSAAQSAGQAGPTPAKSGHIYLSGAGGDGGPSHGVAIPKVARLAFGYQDHHWGFLNAAGWSLARLSYGPMATLFEDSGKPLSLMLKFVHNSTVAAKGRELWLAGSAAREGPLLVGPTANKLHPAVSAIWNQFASVFSSLAEVKTLYVHASPKGLGIKFEMKGNAPMRLRAESAAILGKAELLAFSGIFTLTPGSAWFRFGVEVEGKFTPLNYCTTDANCPKGYRCNAAGQGPLCSK